jgi:hypothetical protein
MPYYLHLLDRVEEALIRGDPQKGAANSSNSFKSHLSEMEFLASSR